jgi:hypothetical protein
MTGKNRKRTLGGGQRLLLIFSTMNAPTYISIFALVVSLVGAVAAFWKVSTARYQIKTQNLLQISNFLHQPENRDARHRLRAMKPDSLDMDTVSAVCSAFDFAALFVKNELVSEKIFLQYWKPWLIFLRGHLAQAMEQEAFGEMTMHQYYRHFSWLMERAAKTA